MIEPVDGGAAPSTLLLGAVSRDIYVDSGEVLPGGGILNVAYHWRRLGFPFHLLTRIGREGPALFLDLLQAEGIPHEPASIVADGESAAIDVAIQPDNQPYMDNFVEGVWATFSLTPEEERRLGRAVRLHAVLVEGVIRELHRLGAAGLLRHLEVAADFLSFRHYTMARFAETMAHVDIGFIGWPGSATDAEIADIRQIAFELRKLVVITLGSRGVIVFDGRTGALERRFDVTPVPVVGTTVGCGDAFIAYFLAEFWRTGDVVRAVEQGKIGGARATAWRRPLPDETYGSLLAPSS